MKRQEIIIAEYTRFRNVWEKEHEVLKLQKDRLEKEVQSKNHAIENCLNRQGSEK